MLTYKKTDNLKVVGYSDSDYAGCKDDFKSTSGYIFMLAKGAISWNSLIKQSLRTSSTMEAGCIAYYKATKQALWLRNFVMNLKIIDSVSRPL